MKRIKLVPFYGTDSEDYVFSEEAIFNFPYTLRRKLKEEGYDLSTLHLFSESDFVLLFRLDCLTTFHVWKNGLFNKVIYLAMEPPVVKPMHAPESLQILADLVRNVFTWQDDLLNKPRMEKFFFPTPRTDRPMLIPFGKKRLITAIVGKKSSLYDDELYSERVKAINFFQKKMDRDFLFYGGGWSKYDFPCCQGPVRDKIATLAQYRFSISYENQKNINGLISEKIFDSMLARCIPVFWGAPNINSIIPSNCFIDIRMFSNYDELYCYLIEMNEYDYNCRLAAIDDFLGSEMFARFSGENLASRLVEVLNTPGDSAIPKRPNFLALLLTVSRLWVKDFYWRGSNRLLKVFS